ncbi:MULTISPECIES: hypothetical protein [unclassified Pseudomonas]|nr:MULTISPECIES: hypothetical protein [unclassified Pseudomonas]
MNSLRPHKDDRAARTATFVFFAITTIAPAEGPSLLAVIGRQAKPKKA